MVRGSRSPGSVTRRQRKFNDPVYESEASGTTKNDICDGYLVQRMTPSEGICVCVRDCLAPSPWGKLHVDCRQALNRVRKRLKECKIEVGMSGHNAFGTELSTAKSSENHSAKNFQITSTAIQNIQKGESTAPGRSLRKRTCVDLFTELPQDTGTTGAKADKE
ncbi:hypothetical protein SISNIDRAFT_502392 [Sistotremastrum niveocremeum HHB9708]|uniref:Uncharacterized protein n=1 Tax=Sistotremastrum niveocremeum HHB9708 TaxID=1314777 RepID=A0A164WB15_9AGAM|nr:hypothetical protein SISNIDRAFT_502392 [Sistotremastrum niveocremeum HHB9708]